MFDFVLGTVATEIKFDYQQNQPLEIAVEDRT